MKSKWLLEYHFVRGDYGMCKKIIQKVSNIEDPRLTECLIYYQGRINLAENNISDGLQQFQNCYSKDANNPIYLQSIAKCLIAQRRYKKAVEALMHVRRLMPCPNFVVLYDLSRCYVNLSEYDSAEETCREAIRIFRSKPVYKLLAHSLIHQNKIGEAIEVFRFALRMFPKSSQLYTSFGKLCARMNFEEDALKTLSTATKLDASNLVALNELAVLHQKRGDSEEAINLYRDLLRRGGESVEVYNNLGLCYFYKEKFVLALTCLLKARDIDPLCSETMFNLGLVFINLNQFCSAAIHWTTAMAINSQREEKELQNLIPVCMSLVLNKSQLK